MYPAYGQVIVSNTPFDVTPAGLVDFLVTEAGVAAAPDREKLAALVQGSAET